MRGRMDTYMLMDGQMDGWVLQTELVDRGYKIKNWNKLNLQGGVPTEINRWSSTVIN